MLILYEDVRMELVEYGKKLGTSNLTVGTWGNISVRIPGENKMAITPSAIDYETISPKDIVIMDFEGRVIDGFREPSTEFMMHSEILKNREDVHAVVHTHSDYVGAFAVSRKPIPACSEDMVQIVGGDVRVSDYILPGTKELGEAVVRALAGRTAVVLANHGGVAVGRNLKEAFKTALVIEKGAKQAVYASLLGGVVSLSDEDIHTMREFYLNSYSK